MKMIGLELTKLQRVIFGFLDLFLTIKRTLITFVTSFDKENVPLLMKRGSDTQSNQYQFAFETD